MGWLLRAEDSLERAQRARKEAAARASAIDLEVKASTRLLETRQDAKALRALEAAAAKYPESAQLQSLLAEVRKAIQEQQRSAQIVQMRSQAQVALAGQQYEEALACADQALQLDPADQASVVLREEIQKAISLGKVVRDSLRRAESALYAGDFDEARETVDAALRLDPDSAEARALAEIVDKELSERSRRLQVQELVDSARQGIAQRMFGDAIESLRKAEQLDPGDSNVRELLQWASRGQDQEQRRKDLMDLTDQIHGALRAEDFSSADTICEAGLGSFPNEPSLLRLKSIAEKQRDAAERRRFVQDQSLAAKELLDRSEFDSAIKLLETALQKLPAEPNLEALLALAKTESQRQSESQAAQEAAERALLQNQAAQRQAAELRKALDGAGGCGSPGKSCLATEADAFRGRV